MSVTPSPSLGPDGFSSPSQLDFSRPDSQLEDVDTVPQVSAAPPQHDFDPYNRSTFPFNRPKQPGQGTSGSPLGKLNTGLSSGSWVGPVSSPSSHSIPATNSLRSPSRLAFEEDSVSPKKAKMKKVYIIAGAAGVAFALALIIALVVVFGTKGDGSNAEGDGSGDGNKGLGDSNGQTGGTTNPPPIVIDEPVVIVDAGTWGDWSEYSVCGVTCGGGYSTRTRDCLSGSCVGVNTQSETCNTERCPPSVIYGSWTTWGDWYGCPLSCGGSKQFRERSCVKQTDEEDCVGERYQNRDCNTFDCPDCNKTCASGTLSDDCTHCECGEKLYGRVISGGIQLAGATISPVETPTAVIATTGADGMLNLTNQCFGVNYIIQKDGYIGVEISTSNLGTDSVKIIDMAELRPLSIVTHPQDRMRLVGESATLCCESTGSPEANDYEWLRDGNIVATTSGGASSTMEFTSLTLDDAGYYSCRANNDYGAILSSEAHINVKATADEFCNHTPQSSVIELPDGCTYNGGSTFDVGACQALACRGDNPDTGSCADDLDNAYCCGPTAYSVVEIPCEDEDESFTIPVNMAKECGCVLCPNPQLSVAGTAYGNETVLENGDIIWNGSVIANTTLNGTFEFNVPIGTERISLLFRDTRNRILLDTIYVVDFPKNAEGMYYITVLMLASAMTVQVDASDGAQIELPSVGNSSEPVASVSIPPNSFVSADGEPYTGPVSISMGVVDPEDATSLESSPGDFSATGENGERVQLESSGMLSFSITDENGEPLAVSADVELEIPDDDDNVVLWSMNTETGQWEPIDGSSASRKKSNGNKKKLNGIKYTSTWYNFDKIRDSACYSKVRVFYTSDVHKDDQVKRAQVSAIIKTKKKGKKKGTNSLSRVRPWSDYGYGDSNGYCVIHPCASYRGAGDYEYSGWIMAHRDGKALAPIDYNNSPDAKVRAMAPSDAQFGVTVKKNKFKIDNIALTSADTYGPFYDWSQYWSYSPKCSDASFEDKHFGFSANVCYREYNLIEYTTKARESCIEDYLLLFYGLPSLEVLSFPYRVAFIKVSTVNMYNAKVIAASRVRHQRTITGKGKENTVIGTRKDCIDNEYQMVCLEFKPPSEIGCSLADTFPESTFILKVRVKGGGRVYAVNPELKKLAGENIKKAEGDKAFKMFVDSDHDYRAEHGIYFAEDPDKNIALRMAKQNCMAGSDDYGAKRDVTSDNWAVQFNECKDETNVIIAIANLDYHFHVSTMRWVIKDLSAIANALAGDNVRVGLMDTVLERYNESPVIIDLNSRVSQWKNISKYFEDELREEFYEFDHIQEDHWDYHCYYDDYKHWNGSVFHHVERMIERANNPDAQNIVILVSDWFECDWCRCYDWHEMSEALHRLSTDGTKFIRLMSYPHDDWWGWYDYEHNTNVFRSEEDRFGFNQTEALVNRVKTVGCIFD